VGIGARIREERLKLKLNQTEFAEAAGVKKNAQSNYEKDLRVPDANYLEAALRMGCDVVYVLTGRRAGATGGFIAEKRSDYLVVSKNDSIEGMAIRMKCMAEEMSRMAEELDKEKRK